MRTIIPWSGGIDSTYLLARALKELPDELVVFHMYLKNHENRQDKEAEACNKMLDKLRSIRMFHLEQCGLDYSTFPTLAGWDVQHMVWNVGVLARCYKQIGKKIDRFSMGTHESEGHWNTRFDAIIPAIKAATLFYDPPRFEFLFPWAPKSEEIRYLKEVGLYDDCWYCRWPTAEGNRCNKCPTCNEVDEALKALDAESAKKLNVLPPA